MLTDHTRPCRHATPTQQLPNHAYDRGPCFPCSPSTRVEMKAYFLSYADRWVSPPEMGTQQAVQPAVVTSAATAVAAAGAAGMGRSCVSSGCSYAAVIGHVPGHMAGWLAHPHPTLDASRPELFHLAALQHADGKSMCMQQEAGGPCIHHANCLRQQGKPGDRSCV